MSRLSEEIKRLVQDYPGSTAELARRCGIDRSTLYKIFSGQRQPTPAQLQSLLEVLQLPARQSAALTGLLRSSRESQGDRALHRAVSGLVTGLFRVQQALADAHTLRDAALPPLQGEPPAFLADSALQRRWVLQALCRYLESGDTRPLMLSPTLPPLLRELLLQAFCRSEGPAREVWQLFLFARTGEPEQDLCRNLELLRQYLPLLFVDRMNCQGRLCYTAALPPLPGSLLSACLLLPDTAFLTDPETRGLLCIRDPQAVEFLRLQYNRHYRQATLPDFLDTRSHAALPPEEGMFCLGAQPPLHLLTLADAPLPNGYFTAQGLVEFIRTGVLKAAPAAPLPPEERLALVRRLREACSRATLRLVEDRLLPPGLWMEAHPRRGLLLRRTVSGHSRQVLLQEPQLAHAVCRDLEQSRTESLILSQKSTLEFLDYCIAHGATITG